jgi:glycine/D-amino acid oxidase-like deaminating enzyme
VAVVGGGVIGAATAWALGRLRPGLRVVVVEAERLAFGASGRNAGFLLPGTHRDPASAAAAYGAERARRLLRFTLENVALVDALARETPAFGYAPTGHWTAAGTPEEAERLRASVALFAQEGVSARYLDAAEAARRIGAEGFAGALEIDAGGSLFPARLVRLLAATSGADVLEGWPVASVEPGPEGVRLGSADGEALDATQVLLALNAYLPRLRPELERFVRPVRAQMLATAPVAERLGRPVYSHEGYYYLRQHPDGSLLLGGARHLHVDQEVGYEDATTEGLQASLLAYLRTHFPRLGEPPVAHRWGGAMGFSPDSLPVVGAVPGVSGAHFACGFTGHGMGFAARFGRLLAHRLVGEADEAADLFDAARFDGAP